MTFELARKMNVVDFVTLIFSKKLFKYKLQKNIHIKNRSSKKKVLAIISTHLRGAKNLPAWNEEILKKTYLSFGHLAALLTKTFRRKKIISEIISTKSREANQQTSGGRSIHINIHVSRGKQVPIS